MIHIYRSKHFGEVYDPEINVFHNRDFVNHDEVRLVHRNLPQGPYVHAEPAEPGSYAFGGSFLYTSNGVFPEFNKPIPLHDRDISKERG